MSRNVGLLRKAVYVVAARRTPCGAFGGPFKDLTATDLAVAAANHTIKDAGISAEKIDSVVIGNVAQTSGDAAYLARHVALRAGAQLDTPALTVNRLCGSGFEALVQGAREIINGEAHLVLAGGTESMSQAPYAVRNIRFGTKLGVSPVMEDTLWQGLTDSLCNTPMGVTAENLATKYNISRQECDEFALSSQQKWKKAHDAGIFNAEIAPVTVKQRRKEVEISVDEHPRSETTLEGLAKLPTVFKKDGAVTAASSSGICDGGATLLLASEEALSENPSLTPLARIVGYGIAGVEPTEMGIGPVPAVRKLLDFASINLGDIDMVEINEAFGAQCLAVAKELGIDLSKLNMHGGAIAIGHPLGMSGARIMTHLAHMTKAGLTSKYALGGACIGGGQGIAVLLEKA